METLDYFIVATGAILIAIGLYLFAAGKQSSESSNNVEGFGIKLNVSNPSIILIVLGIGLILVPRFMPKADPPPIIPTPPPLIAPGPQGGSQVDASISPTPSGPQPAVAPQEISPSKTEQPTQLQDPAVFLPSDNWFMNNYEENGIDLSASVSGNIAFEGSSRSQVSWQANVAAMDMWGNGTNYFYRGSINANNAGHQLSIANSNDPSFTPQNGLPLTLKVDPSGLLHMEYFYLGNHIIIHWRK